MAKTRDMWDTQPFDDVNLDYKLNVPIFRQDDAVANTSKHLIRLNKVPFKASPLVRIFHRLICFFSAISVEIRTWNVCLWCLCNNVPNAMKVS